MTWRTETITINALLSKVTLLGCFWSVKCTIWCALLTSSTTIEGQTHGASMLLWWRIEGHHPCITLVIATQMVIGSSARRGGGGHIDTGLTMGLAVILRAPHLEVILRAPHGNIGWMGEIISEPFGWPFYYSPGTMQYIIFHGLEGLEGCRYNSCLLKGHFN